MACSTPTIRNHQQWHGTHYSPLHAIAHGCGHGVINNVRKGSAIVGNIIRDDFSPNAVVDVSPLTNLPGLRPRHFSRIHIGSRLPSLTLSRSRMRGSLRCASGTLSMQRRCSSTVAAQSIPVQPIQKRVCNRVTIHRSFPFQGRTDLEVSCGRKGLGNARKAFGEFRNV